jgi:hypothetical protein
MRNQCWLLVAVVSLLISISSRAEWPARVFVPYMYLGAGDDFKLTDCDDATGQKFYTLAFIITGKDGQPAWDGRWGIAENRYADQIEAIRKRGGDVIVSFGGEAGDELAIKEADSDALFAKYQHVIDQYKFNWLDFDIEGKALHMQEINQRRNAVIKRLQDKYPSLRISFTIPVDPDGIPDSAIKMMFDAKAKGVRIHSANIMTMYFGKKFDRKMSMMEMCTASATKAHEQTQAIDPAIKISLCPMVGDNEQKEVFTVSDAKALTEWATGQPWISNLTFWCSNRDAMKGKKNGNTNSGIEQKKWEFTEAMKGFTGK